MIVKNSYKLIAVLFILLSLTGCAHRPIIKYNPDDFTNPNHIITKKIKVQAPTPKINASFGIGDNPKVVIILSMGCFKRRF
jgi:hypothetical protein